MKISAIVAMSVNRVIGKNNQLPWHLPEDLKRFRAITMNHPIIMGRKTFESIGRVLPGRKNIVISRNPSFQVSGAVVVSSIDEALLDAEREGKEIFVIGGAEIYALAMAKVQRIYLTRVHQEIEGDAFLPELGEDFKEVSREDFSTPVSYSFIVLERADKK